MPDFSFDRRNRADAVPTASSGPRSSGDVDHPMNGNQQEIQLVAPPLPVAIDNSEHSQSLTAGEQALLDHVRQHEGDAEVICIVRPRGASQSDSEVFMLQNASSNFVKRLSDAHKQGGGADK
ncbi:MAG: hypothetical protein HOB45_13160, partial [Planctomycetaceae bacterium]|nr:hypothetical protein [Planctomycetaceae bacterium]